MPAVQIGRAFTVYSDSGNGLALLRRTYSTINRRIPMKTLKSLFLSFALAGGLLFTVPAAVAQHVTSAPTIVPAANTCVRLQNAPDGFSSTDFWTARYRFTNGCSHEVRVIWRYNYGSEGQVKCSAGSAHGLRPEGSYTLSAGTLPRGVGSKISWCAHYLKKDIQDLTGYANCYQANQPTCP